MNRHSKNILFVLALIAAVSGCKFGQIFGDKSAGKYSAMLEKTDELANLKTVNDSVDTNQGMRELKGKIAVVKKDPDGQIRLDRFNADGTFSELPVNKFSPYLPPEIYAKTPEEIETLIKVECRKFRGEDIYSANAAEFGGMQEFVNTICGISVIDLKSKTLLAKTQKGDERPQTILDAAKYEGETAQAVADFFASLPFALLPRSKPAPLGEQMTVAELIEKFKKSKDNLSEYQDKAITVSGWGFLTGHPVDSILIYGDEKRTGLDYVSCVVEPSDAVSFADVKAPKEYKFTVAGNFDGRYSKALNKCRMIEAKQISGE